MQWLRVLLARLAYRTWEALMCPSLIRKTEIAGADVLWLTQMTWVARSIYVAAELQIAERLVDGPRTAAELAHAAGVDGPTLYRVLRLLAAFGIFAEDRQGRFQMTRRAQSLLGDAPKSIRHWILHCGTLDWQMAGALPQSVRTGRTAAEILWSKTVWGHMLDEPEAQRNFIEGMNRWNDWHTEEILAAYDFAARAKVVDVGGGRGALLAAILAAHPTLRGVLYDQPATGAAARPHLEAAGVASRCEIVGGSFLESVPPGGDLYLLKHVLHDWDDPHAATILKNVREALDADARLLVINGILREGNGVDRLLKTNDLEYLGEGGCVRTLRQFDALFQQAGLRRLRIRPTRIQDITIIELERT